MPSRQKRSAPKKRTTTHHRTIETYLDAWWPALTKRQRAAVHSFVERNLTTDSLPIPTRSEFHHIRLKDPTKGKRRKLGASALGVSGMISTAWGLKGLLAGTAISIAGVAIPIWPFALVGAALTLGDKAKTLKGESFHEDEALLLWTLWLEKDDDDWVDEASFAKALNRQRKLYQRPPMTEAEIAPLIRQIEKLKIVVRTASPPGWNVKERIDVV